MTNILNRFGTTKAVADMLRTDTGTLYGNRKLINNISSSPTEYTNERVSIVKPYNLFCWIEEGTPVEVRASNSYIDYLVSLRFRAKQKNFDKAYESFDKAYERIEVLVNYQMSEGLMMTNFYSDPNAQIYNIEMTGSNLSSPEDNGEGLVVLEATGAILVQINRYEQP